MDFVNFKEHLQHILDSVATDTFEVSDTRDMVGKTNKVSVVFTPLAGSVFENSASIPYQIDIFSTKPDDVINVFTQIAKAKNSKSFISVVTEGTETKEYTVFEFYSTPAVAEKQLDFGTNTYVRLVMYVTLNVLFEVGNVSSIKIDGENIEFVNGSMGYATEMFSNRQTGGNLNKARKKAATTNLQFTMVNKTGVFTNKIFQIMFGSMKGQTNFTVEVTLTNGISGTLKMILSQNQFSFARNTPSLPSLNITLTNGDER